MFVKLIQGTDMNLRLGNGKVPIYTEGGYVFIDFPSMDDFCQLYNNYTKVELREKYWHIMSERAKGKTLKDCGSLYGLSKQRVREIEAKFMRLITQSYFYKLTA